ncbi:MAG: hypothetical protein HOP37_09905 [Cyclobacteriaceae bacterium]|nr:hypothetical protein [Cyclobacteriaceae bacterium]
MEKQSIPPSDLLNELTNLRTHLNQLDKSWLQKASENYELFDEAISKMKLRVNNALELIKGK